jgi:serine/threonine protein kinase
MGVVYRARHRQSGRLVALKTVRVPRSDLLSGIRREVHALARLKHPQIVRILDEGVQEGVPWYAMELLDGITLRQVLAGPSRQAETRTQEPPPEPWWTRSIEDGPGLTTRSFAEAGPERAALAMPLPGKGRDVQVALTAVRRLCGPLAFLHGEGMTLTSPRSWFWNEKFEGISLQRMVTPARSWVPVALLRSAAENVMGTEACWLGPTETLELPDIVKFGPKPVSWSVS